MKKPTIYDIKKATMDKTPHFFDRKTLKFFGQTLKDFTVQKSPSGKIFITANQYHEGRHYMGKTFREFLDGRLVIPDLESVRRSSKTRPFPSQEELIAIYLETA